MTVPHIRGKYSLPISMLSAFSSLFKHPLLQVQRILASIFFFPPPLHTAVSSLNSLFQTISSLHSPAQQGSRLQGEN